MNIKTSDGKERTRNTVRSFHHEGKFSIMEKAFDVDEATAQDAELQFSAVIGMHAVRFRCNLHRNEPTAPDTIVSA